MGATVLGEIDELRRLANTPNSGFGNCISLADESDDTAVVIGIHLAVEQIHALNLHGFDDGVNFRAIAALGKIGNTLNQRGHCQKDSGPNSYAAT
jgi:hypothetical protein